MAGYRKKNADGPNSEDKALDLFAEMMIEKIEGIQKDWKKPWFTEGTLFHLYTSDAADDQHCGE